MKSIKYTIAIATCLIVLGSCSKDFIDLTPPTALPPANFYKTEIDIKSAVTGIYGSLQSIYRTDYQLTEMPSDNTQTYSESEAGIGIWDKMTWVSSSTNGTWFNHYNTISQCNIVLEKIELIAFANPATKTQYIAEAKFIRSLMFFNMVRYFGNVPLVTKVIKTEEDAYAFNRDSTTEVFSQIEKDLTDAETGVPVAYSATADKGRVTAGAVKSLLGKVHLQQKKYQLAETKLKEVSALSPATYDLLPNYADVFSTSNEFNKEIVFTIQYSRIAVGSGEGSLFARDFVPEPSGNTINATGGASYNIGTLDLYRSFEPGDKRKNLIGVYTKGSTDSAKFYYYTRKFVDNAPSPNDGENNCIVIRYSDVLLMLAEALNEQGKTAEALLSVQSVRNRAGLTTDLGLDQASTRKLIKKERRVELCYEGHRWPDLIRWNDYVEVMTNFKTRYNVPSIAFDANKKFFPIPQREITLNPNLNQNTGY